MEEPKFSAIYVFLWSLALITFKTTFFVYSRLAPSFYFFPHPQDLVCKTFYEFWFEENTGSHTQFFGDDSSVPLEVAKKVEQIVEMLRRIPTPHHLVTVIKRNLALDFFPQAAKAAGINPVLLASVRNRCELMCKFLLERILQVFNPFLFLL